MYEGVFYKGADNMQKHGGKVSKKYIAKTRNLVYCIFKCKIHTHEIDNEGEENGHKGQRLYY